MTCRLEQIVVGEVLYVMQKVYKIDKSTIVGFLSKLLKLQNIVCDDKEAILSALEIYTKKSIDFADAILCAKADLRGFEVFSFDKDIAKCVKKATKK